MFSNKIKETTNDTLNNADAVSKEVKKSGKDWLGYVQDHPLQSLLFGAVIGLAIKGLLKK